MINKLFDWCVDILEYSAQKLGTTYEAINVWVFMIIGPIIFLGLIVEVIILLNK